MERTLVPPTGLQSYFLPMAPPSSLRGLVLLALATLRSLGLLLRIRPRVTVGTGGYVTVPPALASWLVRVPLVLYLPDVVPGKAVAALVPLARRIAVTAEDSFRYLPTEKVVVTGYPVRDEFLRVSRESARVRFGLPLDAAVLLVSGGSQGSQSINRALAACLPQLLDRCHIIHVSGRPRFEEARAASSSLPPEQQARYHLVPYFEADAMADALAAADLAVTRGGASALGELPATGTPGVLVPLPISGVHQRENAEYLARRGAAVVLEDTELEARLSDVLTGLLGDRARLQRMAAASRALATPDAADRIARLVMEAGS